MKKSVLMLALPLLLAGCEGGGNGPLPEFPREFYGYAMTSWMYYFATTDNESIQFERDYSRDYEETIIADGEILSAEDEVVAIECAYKENEVYGGGNDAVLTYRMEARGRKTLTFIVECDAAEGKKMKDFRAEARLTAETYEEFAALLAERIELKDPDRPEVSVVLRKGHGIVEVDFGEYAIWRDRL